MKRYVLMKSKSVLALLLLLGSAPVIVSAQTGKIKTITYSARMADGKVVTGEAKDSLRELYNEKGDLVRRKSDPDARYVPYVSEYFYDPQGNLIKMTQFGFVKKECVYDAGGNLSREKRYLNPGELSEVVDYQYDANGNLLQKSERDVRLNSVWRSAYTYDQKGNKVGYKRYSLTTGNFSEHLENFETYEYDSKNKKTAENKLPTYDGDSSYRTVYEYGSNGKIVKETGYFNGVWSMEKTYAYNSRNDLAVIVVKDDTAPEQKGTYEYVYDAWGNWTKRIYKYEKSGNAPAYEIKTRSISYY